MDRYESAIQSARDLEHRNFFRRAANKWGEALSFARNKKQEQECTKNGFRCVQKAKVTIRKGW
ncbi:PerC family transcriptional regulator [Xenorhabdus sp. Flor]|uniref:PerC family transcriptional regulator n=1 Tax=Xenorhabdus cabanillasii TaxID=351673 RepID=UPI001989D746|nr:PerC family transcriptional regulator [Xenorhabdus sp. Flor]MBD2816798.1 PerC family transcriptional regulator [Xenorhabdus sp. Flor]